MVRRGAILAGLAALLTGCGGGGSSEGENGQAPRIRMANPFHDDLMKLPPNLQRLGLMRAIRDTGNRCQRVDNAGYQQEYENMRMWVAVCGVEEKSFAVYIAPNGTVQARDCAHAGELSLPRCQPLPPPAPDDTGPQFQKGAADEAYRNKM